MYLTKCILARSPDLNPYLYHRKIWQLFPEETDAKRDFLFWVQEQNSKELIILLQSQQKPIQNGDSIKIIQTKEYNPVVKSGKSFRFIIRTNPIKTIKDLKGRKNSKGDPKAVRVPLIKEKHLENWIKKRFANKAELLELSINVEPETIFWKQRKKGIIRTVLFKGIIKIENEPKFRELIKKGIGPAKAFGCGLLLIKPV